MSEHSTHWMRALAEHYQAARTRHPETPLLVLFDIDGTILDTRHTVAQILRSYDREHDTTWFRNLRASDVDRHENRLGELLRSLGIAAREAASICDYFESQRWSLEAMTESHRPFRGVLEVLRWFQLQPRTEVALVTGRLEAHRDQTRILLQTIGARHRVTFDDDHLFMRGTASDPVPAMKVAGVRHFRDRGHHVVAFVDNEPENLAAIAQEDTERSILLLHADTIFESEPTPVPRPWAAGRNYDLTELISRSELPARTQFVWHGINDRDNLAYFLASDVRWGEFDVRVHPHTGELVLRHDPFGPDEVRTPALVTLDECLSLCRRYGRSAKLDLKQGHEVLDDVLAAVRRHGLSDDEIWFNGTLETLGVDGIQRLASQHPGAVVQCPAGFLVPLMRAVPEEAERLVKMMVQWGVNRFSVDWAHPHLFEVFECFTQWGHDVNIYNVPDLEGFLRAVLLSPRSITSDFNFPKWKYFGLGSGASTDRAAVFASW